MTWREPSAAFSSQAGLALNKISYLHVYMSPKKTCILPFKAMHFSYSSFPDFTLKVLSLNFDKAIK